MGRFRHALIERDVYLFYATAARLGRYTATMVANVTATHAAHPSGASAPLRSGWSPPRLLSHAGPVTNDSVTSGLRQASGHRVAAGRR